MFLRFATMNLNENDTVQIISVKMTKNPEYSKSNDNLSVQVCQPVKEREIIDVLNIYIPHENK